MRIIAELKPRRSAIGERAHVVWGRNDRCSVKIDSGTKVALGILLIAAHTVLVD